MVHQLDRRRNPLDRLRTDPAKSGRGRRVEDCAAFVPLRVACVCGAWPRGFSGFGELDRQPRAQSAVSLGDLEEAERTAREALSLAREIGDKRDVRNSLCRRATALGSLGRIDEALAVFGEANAISE